MKLGLAAASKKRNGNWSLLSSDSEVGILSYHSLTAFSNLSPFPHVSLTPSVSFKRKKYIDQLFLGCVSEALTNIMLQFARKKKS